MYNKNFFKLKNLQINVSATFSLVSTTKQGFKIKKSIRA